MTLSRLSASGLYNVSTGIVGAGNWASITATTGSPTTGTYTDGNGVAWKWYQWNSSASVTVTAGLVDLFMISGGAASAQNYDGSGGRALLGLHSLSAGTLTVTVGAGGTAGPYVTGLPSSIGSLTTYISPGFFGGLGGTQPPGGNSSLGLSYSITGSAVTYGRSGAFPPIANRGDGANGTSPTNGGSGVVIIRVPTAFAIA